MKHARRVRRINKKRRLRLGITLLVELGLTCAYATKIPPHTAHPPPLAAPILPRLESLIPVKLSADLTQPKNDIINAIPTRFNNDDLDVGGGKHFRYTFVLSKALNVGPFHIGIPGQPGDNENPKVALSAGLISVKATYGGDIESKFFPGCHLKPVFPVVHVSFRPGIIQRGADFVLGALDAQASIDLAPGSDTNCGAFGFENLFVDVKGKLSSALNSPAVTGKILSTIAAAHKDVAASDLFGPFCMNFNAAPEACLYPNPVEIWAGGLSGSISAAQVDTGFRGFPSVILGTTHPGTAPAPITLRLGNPPPNTQLKVFFPIAVPYAALNAQLSTYFTAHKDVSIDKWKFEILSVSASDASGRVLVAITVKGKLNGTFFVWGTPHVRAGGTILEFPDLQLAVESKSILDRIKLGLAQLVFGNLGDKIKSAAAINLADPIDKARAALARTYTIGSVSLVLNLVPSLGPDEQPVYSRPEGIVANVMFQGSASVNIP